MKPGEQLRIRAHLAGLTSEAAGALIGLSPDRARELLGGRGAFSDLPELRARLRDALKEMSPHPRNVRMVLETGDLVAGGKMGEKIRWTRIVLDIGLRKWSAEHGLSTWWWSKFETEPGFARGARWSLGSWRIAVIEEHMIEAAAKLSEVPSWSSPAT